MKTLIISSSLSSSSRSFHLCKEVYNKLRNDNIDAKIIDAREIELLPYHMERTKSMEGLRKEIRICDNIIIGMGVHCYSVNDGLKIILDNCFEGAIGKFFGIICAAGGEKSYLSTMHLTQICMNEWRMIQLPRILYATKNDFKEDGALDKNVHDRLYQFCSECMEIGIKLI